MTAAEKLRMEIAQEAPFSKDEFISKISRLIKAYGYASFICDKKNSGMSVAMEYLRISKQECVELYKASEDKLYFKYLLFNLGIVDR